MPVAPINFIASFGLVPIFEWEPIEPTDSTEAPPPPPASCTSPDVAMQQAPADTSSPQMRLVFKGFGWRPGVEIARYPSPSWMSGLASGSDDASDLSTKRDDRNSRPDEAAARARKAALAAHPQPDVTSSSDSPPTAQDPSETS